MIGRAYNKLFVPWTGLTRSWLAFAAEIASVKLSRTLRPLLRNASGRRHFLLPLPQYTSLLTAALPRQGYSLCGPEKPPPLLVTRPLNPLSHASTVSNLATWPGNALLQNKRSTSWLLKKRSRRWRKSTRPLRATSRETRMPRGSLHPRPSLLDQ